MLASVSLSPVLPAQAQIAQSQQNAANLATAAGLGGGPDLITIIGRIINVFLGLLGVIFLGLLLYAGFTWMTSNGDEEKIRKAQGTIKNAVIGLIIIASAWAITAFILNALTGVQENAGGISQRGPAGGFGQLSGSSGSLGNGIIETHLPARDATDVPRNTPIIITFKEAIDPASFIANWTVATSNTVSGVNADLIKIHRTDSPSTTSLNSDAARVRYTSDHKTFVIKPVDYLGSPTANVGYTVELVGGANGIKKEDGSAAFGGAFSSGYIWQFEVSTVADLEPPFVTAVIPFAGGTYARNIVVQINFNKPMDPTATTGKTADGFSNITVESTPTGSPQSTPVAGSFTIANQYQTVEFATDVTCGRNSCGKEIFCLPANTTIRVTAKAATLDPTAKPQAQLTSNGYDGVVSVVGNSLDGNRQNGAEGPPTDDYVWQFGTSDAIKLAPPQIETTMPSSDPKTGGNSNIPLDQTMSAVFDSLLQVSTLTSVNAKIDAHGKDETNADTFWWTVGMDLLDQTGAAIDPNATPPGVPTKAAVILYHRPFLPSGTGVENLNFYDPYLFSGIQDAYQNCFNPAALCGTGKGNPNCCNSNPTALGCKDALKTP